MDKFFALLRVPVMPFDFIVEPITLGNSQEAASLVVNTFNESEPLAVANDAPPEVFSDFILQLTEQCAAQGLGFVAKESNSNKIIGAVLAGDLAHALTESAQQAEQDNPISALIQQLNGKYFAANQLELNSYLSIKFVAMNPNNSGRGVVNDLLQACISNAKNKGFGYAQAEATGNISQHIFINKLDFEEKAFIQYSKFDFNGNKPFAGIAEHQGIKLVVKSLN